MRVRISYIVNADDDLRKAIRHQWGECGTKATRSEMQTYFRNVGEAEIDDLMQEYQDCDTGCHPERDRLSNGYH